AWACAAASARAFESAALTAGEPSADAAHEVTVAACPETDGPPCPEAPSGTAVAAWPVTDGPPADETTESPCVTLSVPVGPMTGPPWVLTVDSSRVTLRVAATDAPPVAVSVSPSTSFETAPERELPEEAVSVAAPSCPEVPP